MCRGGHKVGRFESLFLIKSLEQSEGSVDQCFHLVEIHAETLRQCWVLDLLDAQSHPGQWRAQVVRHRGEDTRAAIQVAQQPILHRVERTCGITNFADAPLRERGMVNASPHCIRGLCQSRQRSGDVAGDQVQHDGEQDRQNPELGEQLHWDRRLWSGRSDAEDDFVSVRERDRDIEKRTAGTASRTATRISGRSTYLI